MIERLGGKVIMLSKKDTMSQWVHAHPQLNLRCVHCHEQLQFLPYQWKCINGHSFDVAKQGYTFLSKRPSDSPYQKELFELRRKVICNSLFYHKLHVLIREELAELKSPTIIDAGSGEGSHLWKISQNIEQATCVAMDISKDGILLSTDYNADQLHIVADLSDIPLMDQQCDLILSVLSPSNYEEFNRILKRDGRIIKVIPNSGYLREIRDKMVQQGWLKRHEYDNYLVVETFLKHYPQADIHQVSDHVKLSHEMVQAVVEMTPLTWNLKPNQRRVLAELIGDTITLDVSVAIYHK